MLRKVISIPEGVYYRGRFRATTVWSKVSKKIGEDDSVAIVDEADPCGIGVPDGLLAVRPVSRRTDATSLQTRPAER